ncbi:MAG TPA: response regulator [Steroidobacteraceae bacterium]|nr:response regulator [Steroidobacteraceae bacterium]
MSQNTILIVEDDAALLQTISQRLESEGFVVISVPTFEQGVDALASEDIQLLIADIGLPDGNGEDLAASAQAAGIPAICITGLPDRSFYEMPCIVLEKPFRGTQLLDAVKYTLTEFPIS